MKTENIIKQNIQVAKHNLRRFLDGFRLQLATEEWAALRSQVVTLKTKLYHIGAFLKDVDKSWFAFSKMNSETIRLLKQLNLNA